MTTMTQDGAELASELLRRLGQTVGDQAKVSAVFGDPVERDGITVIPVARARSVFGGGGGAGPRAGEASGAGGGGGVAVSPIGYIEVRAGTARFRRILGPSDVLTMFAGAALATLAIRRLLAG
ncbi:MAG: spore germination protein GerW family protein [Gaiellales bacterium]